MRGVNTCRSNIHVYISIKRVPAVSFQCPGPDGATRRERICKMRLDLRIKHGVTEKQLQFVFEYHPGTYTTYTKRALISQHMVRGRDNALENLGSVQWGFWMPCLKNKLAGKPSLPRNSLPTMEPSIPTLKTFGLISRDRLQPNMQFVPSTG